MAKAPLPTITIAIHSFTAKGNGVGNYTHTSGNVWTVEVPFTMPGDLVRAKVFKKNRRFYSARLEEVLTPSPVRIAARCIHFGVCGGCRWQHLPYREQLKYKEESVKALFNTLPTHSHILLPIVPCKNEWHYRNKMEFSFSQNAQGERFLGLMMDSGRSKVINLSECHLVYPWFIDVLKAVYHWWEESGLEAYHPYRDTGSLRTLIVREGTHTQDRLVMLTVSGNPDFALNKPQITAFTQTVKQCSVSSDSSHQFSIFLRIQQARKGHATSFYEMHLDGADHYRELLHVQTDLQAAASSMQFNVSPTAFFQPNTKQAETFYSLALQMAKANKQSIVYDLYCGAGSIGLSLAPHVKQVIGIEISPEAVLDARANAALNNIHNYSVLCGDMRDVLKAIHEEKTSPQPTILIVDPPRVGLDAQALAHLLTFQAPTIVYISCNPKTQVDNIKELIANGYQLTKVQPVDQFPHTIHIENIVILEKLSD